jgi:PKHD-type hydroxylase
MISQPIINKASDGGGYGMHYDTAFMQFRDRFIRTDLSFTLFLTDPDKYDGGELEIDTPLAKTRVKLDKGAICLYQSARWHQVLPVTRGERICCVGWIESNIPSEAMREALWDLTLFSTELTKLGAPQEVMFRYNKMQNSLSKLISER